MKISNPPTKETVEKISQIKKEPKWMLQKRLQSLDLFLPQKNKKIGIEEPDLDQINYYQPANTKKQTNWEEVPEEIKKSFDILGLPEAEKRILAGLETQMDSEAVYGSIEKELQEQGVIFTNIEQGLKQRPDLFKKYFGTLVKPADNKYSALNGAFWSGGSFLYVPQGVQVKRPLQAYFRIGALNLGQFERTLIIAEEGASVNYVEGCTAPMFSRDALHAGAVEVFVEKNASVSYTTVQNWSKNVYNLVTKKSLVKEEGEMRWVDGNLGSKITMKLPACYLVGRGAYGEMQSVSYAAQNQIIHSGARMIHQAQDTKSSVTAKSIAHKGGEANYKGELRIEKNAPNSHGYIKCDSLILDQNSSSNSSPLLKSAGKNSSIEHEASATRIEEEKLQYLKSRGLKEPEARGLMVRGFIDPIITQLPIEYAIEFNKLMEEQLA